MKEALKRITGSLPQKNTQRPMKLMNCLKCPPPSRDSRFFLERMNASRKSEERSWIITLRDSRARSGDQVRNSCQHGPVKVFFLEEYVWWEYEEVGGDDGGTATEKRGKGVAMWAKRGLLGWMQARLRRREIDPGLLCCSGGDATGRSA